MTKLTKAQKKKLYRMLIKLTLHGGSTENNAWTVIGFVDDILKGQEEVK